MSTFPFAKTDTATKFCEDIVAILIDAVGLSRPSAVALVNAYWKGEVDIEDNSLLYHELPYEYAMSMAHHPTLGDNKPDWQQDPRLWPIPEKYLPPHRLA